MNRAVRMSAWKAAKAQYRGRNWKAERKRIKRQRREDRRAEYV